MSELFTHMLVNKSSRQKKVNYVKILSKPLNNLPVKVYVQDFENEEFPGKHDGTRLLTRFYLCIKALIGFCENYYCHCYT